MSTDLKEAMRGDIDELMAHGRRVLKRWPTLPHKVAEAIRVLNHNISNELEAPEQDTPDGGGQNQLGSGAEYD